MAVDVMAKAMAEPSSSSYLTTTQPSLGHEQSKEQLYPP
jgi:hypothetical protein